EGPVEVEKLRLLHRVDRGDREREEAGREGAHTVRANLALLEVRLPQPRRACREAGERGHLPQVEGAVAARRLEAAADGHAALPRDDLLELPGDAPAAGLQLELPREGVSAGVVDVEVA